MTLVRTTWMKPQRCKKWEFGRSGVRTRRDTKKRLWGHFLLPPDDSARSPSSFPPECRSRATPKTTSEGADGGGAHQTLARSLLSSRPVLLLAVLQFLLLSIVLPQIQFVVCDSRRDFTGAPCAYKKTPGAICCKIGSYFVLSVSIYCCCCCCCWSWVVF